MLQAAAMFLRVLKDMLRGGLALLWCASEYARALKDDGQEFAVKGEALSLAGLTAVDLRWLIHCGYVDFSLHSAASADRPWNDKNAFFMLTAAGTALALEVLSGSSVGDAHSRGPSASGGPHFQHYNGAVSRSIRLPNPCWDRDRKELRIGQRVVKHFRWAVPTRKRF